MATPRHRGFSLVELLVVVALMAVLATTAMTGFFNYVAQQRLDAATVELAALLREARQQTLAAEADASYGLGLSADEVTPFKQAPSGRTDLAPVSFAGMTVTPSLTAGTTTIRFARLSGAPSATGTISLTSDRLGTTATVTVRGTGIIE